MKELFLFFKDNKENPPKREDFLKKALLECQQSLDDAYWGLQNTNDPDLIDRYIYELNAANMRYKVLMRDLREVSEELPVPSVKISSTKRETDTSLLNLSFR